jgi:hypothetical protein
MKPLTPKRIANLIKRNSLIVTSERVIVADSLRKAFKSSGCTDQLPKFGVFRKKSIALNGEPFDDPDWYDRLTPEEKAEVDADVACSEDSE